MSNLEHNPHDWWISSDEPQVRGLMAIDLAYNVRRALSQH